MYVNPAEMKALLKNVTEKGKWRVMSTCPLPALRFKVFMLMSVEKIVPVFYSLLDLMIQELPFNFARIVDKATR